VILMAIVRAREPFSYIDSTGVPRMIKPDALFDASDPEVVKRAQLFEPVDVAVSRTETASAAPGEVRARRSVKPKADLDA